MLTLEVMFRGARMIAFAAITMVTGCSVHEAPRPRTTTMVPIEHATAVPQATPDEPREDRADAETKPHAAKATTRVGMPVNLTPGEEPVASSGRVILPYTPGEVAQASALLNGRVRVRALLDSGAAMVAIPRRVARQLGIDVEKLPTMQVSTAGGVRRGWTTMLSEVRVGGLVARHVHCYIGSDRDMGDDVLLGQSFLGRFKTTVDPQRGEIELRSR